MKNYGHQKTMAIITARGGSKRLPHKNIQLLAGKPLIWYAITAALNSRYLSAVYVSTEDEKIAETSKKYGARVIERPGELATDVATSDSVLKHAIEYLNFSGNIVLLQPDSPLIEAKDIDNVLRKYFRWEPSILTTLGPSGEYHGGIWVFNSNDYKKANYNWKELTYINPYAYLISTRKASSHIHYAEDLDRVEQLMKISDDEYYNYEFKNHVAKEEYHQDRIGDLLPYLKQEDGLEKLKIKNPELYKKLRDNPERINLIINLPSGKKCLDVGCSDGLLTIEITRKKCKNILGIDIRDAAIENAMKLRSTLKIEAQKKVDFKKATIEDILISGQKFDTIYLCEVLEHIYYKRHNEFLNNIANLLTPNGNLIVSVPNRYPAKKYEKGERARWNVPAHLSHFSKLSLEDLLSNYFKKIRFFNLAGDKHPQEGIWLVCNCK